MGCDNPLPSPAPRKTSQHPAVAWSLASSDSVSTVPKPRHWCQDCWHQVRPGARIQCQCCGGILRIANPLLEGCPLCHRENFRFDRAIALGGYDRLLRELVVTMKNRHDESLAIQLGHLLAEHASQQDFITEIDCITTVPIHWFRRLTRGFYGPEIIAETVSKSLNLELNHQLIRAVRRTRKQGTLSMTGRRENVRHAFDVCDAASVKKQVVLLIDDVMTTGATTCEVARVLKRAGAAKVYVAVVARGGVNKMS